MSHNKRRMNWVARLFRQRRSGPSGPESLQRRLHVERLEDRVTPATIVWTGAGSNSLWSTPQNWNLGRAPQAGDDIVFNNFAPASNRAPVYNLTGSPTFNSITIAASGYTISAQTSTPTITLSGPITVGVNLGTITISSNLRLTPPTSTLQQTITVNSGSTLVLSGQLSGHSNATLAAQQTLTKAGAGVLELSGDNSAYTGAFVLANNGGIVVVSHHYALGTGAVISGAPTAGETTVNVGAQLQVKSVAQAIPARLRLNGSGPTGTGALYNLAGNNTWAGPIILDSDSTFGGAAGTSLNITGLISDTGSGRNLTKEGEATLIFSRVGGNTYRGQTIINNGILRIRDPLSLGAGATFGTPQHNTPQAGVIVNYNPITGAAGTLQLEFTGTLGANDPNGILLNPNQPFHPTNNPYIGFQVYNQLLTLNGPGYGGIGALSNLAGQNIWSGNITLGSPSPASGAVSIGAESGSSLILSGVLSDPNRQPNLQKVRPGRVILNNANTYTGGTTVLAGALNIRDSKALGTGFVSVVGGATLELEVDSGIDGTPLRNNNRNLGFDSVVGSRAPGLQQGQEIAISGSSGTFTLSFKGQTTAPLAYNATATDIQNALNGLSTITAGGSVTVTQVGSIFRVIFNGVLGSNNQPLITASTSGGVSVTISPIYGLQVANNLSITGNGLNNTGALRSITGINRWTGNIGTGGGSIGVEMDNRPGHPTAGPDYFTYDYSLTVTGNIGGSSLTKLRPGHLILPTGNSYSGDTNIQEGWITIQNSNSLGQFSSTLPITQRPIVVISSGAALHIRGGASGMTESHNYIISGSGISHPYDKLDQNGAVLNLTGVNTLSGILQLNGTAGIGVEQLPPPANQQSQLRLTGYTWDYGNTIGSLLKLGSQRLVIQSPGTYRGDVTVAEGVLLVQNDTALGAPGTGTVTVQSGAALEIANSLTEQNGGVLNGLGIWGKNLVLQGSGNPTFNAATLTILTGTSPATDPLGPVPLTAADHLWRGPVTLASDVTIKVEPNARLTIQGDISEQPNADAGITLTGGGVLNLLGSNSYGGTTYINQGVLTIGDGSALGTPGHPELQTITLTGATAGTTQFTLTFNGQTTSPILYSGDGPTDAAAIQAALNALSTIGGAPTVGGQVTVAPLTPGVFRVSLGGSLSGFDQPLMSGAVTTGPGSISISETRRGGGGTVIAQGASLQLAGSFTVAGEPLLVNGSGTSVVPNLPVQWFQIGPAPVTNGPTPGNSNVIGRVTATAVDPRDSNIMYMALAGGGVWKTIDGGRTWRQIFDAIPEIQEVTVGSSTNFTLTFGTDTTPNLSGSSTAAEVQVALNNLPSIAGQGGNVTVTRRTQGGNVIFRITFGGALAGYDVPELTASPGTVTTVQEGRDPRFAMFIGYIALDPRNPDYIYVGTGEANNSPDSFYGTGIYRSTDGGTTWQVFAGTDPLFYGKGITKIIIDPNRGDVDNPVLFVAVAEGGTGADEIQEIRPNLPTGTQFTLTFTGPNSTGTIVSLTTNLITYDNQNRQSTAAAIEAALNALANIGGIGGSVTVTPPSGRFNNHYTIKFGGALSQTNVQQLTTNLPPPPGLFTIGVSTVRQGGPPGVMNGTPGNAGVWRYSEGSWFLLTDVISTWRSSKGTPQSLPPTDGAYRIADKNGSGQSNIPYTPGPDDDYRMMFPQSNVVWSDIALVYADSLNGGGNTIPILYAALGTPRGDVNNAVFWTQDPMSNQPRWFVGDPGGSPFNDFNSSASPPQPYMPANGTNDQPDQRPDTGFQRGTFQQWSTSTNNWNPTSPSPFNGTIKISAAVNNNLFSTNGSGRFNQIVLYASVADPNGRLRAIYRTTNGGRNWTNVTGNLPNNYMFNIGFFSNALLVVDANTAFIGSQGVDAQGNQTLWMTTNGGGTWTNISVGANGVGPHAGAHHITRDSAGRIIVSTDGGVWRWDGSNWTNLNGNVAGAQVLGVAGHPTDVSQGYAGALSNGVAQFNNSQTWPRVFGSSAGRVAVDPINPNNVYAIIKTVGGTDALYRSTDGGQNWTSLLSSTGSTDTPLVVDPINPSRILVGGNQLQVSLNQGTSWTTLRGGVVRAIAIAQTQGAYVLDPDFTDVADKGSNSYDPDTIYITDGNDIYLTKNGGLTWVNRTGDVSGGGIVDIAVNPRNRDEVYVVRSFLGQNQVWYSTDAGQNWDEIGTANGLPEVPVWKVVVDPRNNNVYVGTDIGVFVLRGGPNSGNRWQRFGIGMPNVQVRDLELNLTTNTLLAGTYGRSVYQMFLDTNWTAATPLAASVVGLSGRTVWAGPVILNDTSMSNQVTVGAYGIPNLPNPRTNASVNFNGPISDLTPNGSPTLRKIGDGDVVLSGTNIYGGATRVVQGALIVDNDQALGRTTNGTTVDNGAVLQLRSNLGPEPITLNGHGQSFDGHFTGALRNIAGDNTYTGTLTLATDATIGVDSGSSLTIGQSSLLPGSGSINGGSFTLNKELLGTLVLAGSNSLGGPVNVYQGALRIGDSNALSSSTTVTVLNGAQIQLADTNGSPVNVGANLSISGTGIFGTGAIRNISGNNTWSGNITLQELSGFAPIAVPPGVVSVAVDRPQDTLTLSGVIRELSVIPTIPMGLEKIGPGRLTLSGANTYSGATEIYAGTLRAAHSSALGNRTTTAAVQRLVIVSEAREGQIVLNFAGQQRTVDWLPNDAPNPSEIQTAIANMISAAGLNGSVAVTRQEIATYTQNGSRGLIGGEAGYAYAYTITFGDGLANTTLPLTAFGRNGAEAMATFVGRGGVNVRVWDGATLELDGSSGNLTIANKHLTLNGSGVGNAGSLRNLAGNNTWNGPVFLASDSTIDVASGSLLTLSGGVQSGSGELRKVGGGTLQFPSGTPANNQSRTVIDAGTVEVLGTLGTVQINGGALQGTGTVGTLTVTSSGGAVRPGDTVAGSTVGTLNAGNTTWNPQTIFSVDLVSPTNHDQLNVTGNIDLGSATLTGTAANSINVGDAFTIIQTSGGTITGQFAGPSTTPSLTGANGATIVYIGGVKFVANYFNNQVVLTRERANVSIQLTTSVTSPVYGQPFTVIATLTPEPLAPLPSGSVDFTYTDPNGNVHTQTVTIDSSGQATFDPTQWGPLELGTHNFAVSYNGQNSSSQQVFNPANATLNVDITAAPTTTTLTGPSSPPSYGQGFTLTATVVSAINPRISGTVHPPQGTVSFYQGSTLLANVALDSSGVATLNTGTLSPPPAAGPQTFTAVYNGDGSPAYYLSSTSNTLNYDITKANSTTTIMSSFNPSVYGQPVTFTATVTGITGGATPTGTVLFRRGSLILGTGTLNASGVATYTTTLGQLPVSTGLTITAEYQGDSNYNSSSASLTQQVTKANTSINLTQSPSSSVYGQPVTFTATVSPVSPGAGTPTGSVTFLLGSTVLGTANLVGGVATFTTTAFQLPVGNLTITAQYTGSPQFNSSTNTITYTVNPAATTTTLSSSANPAVYGQAVTFTAVVAPVSPGAGVPTGTVEFYLGSTLLGTATLDASGAASYTTTVGQLPVGTGLTITANYLGSTNYLASSGSLSQDVNKANTSAVITASFNPSGIDQPVTFTATIQPVSPGGGNPTGTVNFFYNGNSLGSAAITIVNGVSQASITAPANSLPFGTGTVSVMYAGDSNFNGTGGSASHTVLSGTTTTLISLTNPSVYGQPVTLRATVTPTVGSGVPTGTVTFRLGSTILGTATLSGGVATFTTAPLDLPVGNSVAITAIYNGDSLFAQSAGTFLQTVNPASTQVSLSIRPGRAVALQAVRLEAVVGVVLPGGGVPTGTVVFRDVTRNRVLGTAVVDGSGRAVLWSHVGGPLGVHRVRAEYGGDGSYGGSVSGLVGVEVVANGDRLSRVELRSSLNPSNVGVPVTFVAVVRDGVDGALTPTGTVAFYADGSLLGYGVLRRVREGVSRAELTVSGLGVGVHDVVARYSGSEVYGRSVSGVLEQEVRPPATRGSSVVLQVSPGSPTVYGEPLALTAEVVDGGGVPALVPTGVVRFVSDGVEVGRGVLVGVGAGVSRAVVTVTSLGVGEHDLQAEYLGDVDFAGGVWSSVVVHEVGAVGSEVVVSGVGNPSRYGGEVELRAVVRPLSPSVGVATGQVVFRDVGVGVVLGSAVLDGSGVGVLRVRGLGVGVHRIEAEYLGDGNVLGSVGVYDQEVLRSRTGVELSRSTGVGGRRLELVARVVALAPGGGVPGGVVRFIVDGVERGVGVLDGRGVARLVLVRGLSVGRHVVRAVYDGDGNYLGSATTVTWDFTIGRNT